MRHAVLAFLLLALAACGQQTADAPAPEAVEPVGVAAGDELPGLSSPATGIAFWAHPNVAFNGLMIVASADGLASYNIEDGNEVARLDGFDAAGVAVSYLGAGPQAAGVAAFFDRGENAFRFYGIDNASRLFLPIEGGPAIRGNVRGFCFGRAAGAPAPSLYAVQRDGISVFNFDAAASGMAAAGETVIAAPDDIAACAIDIDGVLLAASADGDLYRLDGENAFDAPFARTGVSSIGGLALIARQTTVDGTTSDESLIALLDADTGAVHLIDRADGARLGAVRIEEIKTNDAGEVIEPGEDDAQHAAGVIGASGGNFGAVYRNGVIALGYGGAEPAIRLIPFNGVENALSLSGGEAIDPRGKLPEAEEDGLNFSTGFQPE